MALFGHPVAAPPRCSRPMSHFLKRSGNGNGGVSVSSKVGGGGGNGYVRKEVFITSAGHKMPPRGSNPDKVRAQVSIFDSHCIAVITLFAEWKEGFFSKWQLQWTHKRCLDQRLPSPKPTTTATDIEAGAAAAAAATTTTTGHFPFVSSSPSGSLRLLRGGARLRARPVPKGRR